VKAAENAERPTSNAQQRMTHHSGVSGKFFHWAERRLGSPESFRGWGPSPVDYDRDSNAKPAGVKGSAVKELLRKKS
jgi:hypothetical protein